MVAREAGSDLGCLPYDSEGAHLRENARRCRLGQDVDQGVEFDADLPTGVAHGGTAHLTTDLLRPHQPLSVGQGQNAVGTDGDQGIDLCEKAAAADVQDRAAGAEPLDEKLRAQQFNAEVDRARDRETRIRTTIQTHPLGGHQSSPSAEGTHAECRTLAPRVGEDLGKPRSPVRSVGQA